MAADHDDGQSVAAWTTVGILLVGAAVICFGIGFGIVLLDIIGVVICAIGLIAGKVLVMAGFGVHSQERSDAETSSGNSSEARTSTPAAEAPQGQQQTQE